MVIVLISVIIFFKASPLYNATSSFLIVNSCYTSSKTHTEFRKEYFFFPTNTNVYPKIDSWKETHVRFGKPKFALKNEHNISKLELCVTVLAVGIADFVLRELGI